MGLPLAGTHRPLQPNAQVHTDSPWIFENTLRPAGGQSRPPLQERVCADLRLQAPGFLQGGQKFIDILFGLCVRYVVFCGEGGEERGAVGALFQRAP